MSSRPELMCSFTRQRKNPAASKIPLTGNQPSENHLVYSRSLSIRTNQCPISHRRVILVACGVGELKVRMGEWRQTETDSQRQPMANLKYLRVFVMRIELVRGYVMSVPD